MDLGLWIGLRALFRVAKRIVEKLVIPVLLVGLCYVIGVLFEVLDYVFDVDLPKKWNAKLPRFALNPMMEISIYLDDRAVFWALHKRGRKGEKEKDRRISRVQRDLAQRFPP